MSNTYTFIVREVQHYKRIYEIQAQSAYEAEKEIPDTEYLDEELTEHSIIFIDKHPDTVHLVEGTKATIGTIPRCNPCFKVGGVYGYKGADGDIYFNSPYGIDYKTYLPSEMEVTLISTWEYDDHASFPDEEEQATFLNTLQS